MTRKRSSRFAVLAVPLLLQGCGGGGGAKAVSEALVADDAGCRIQAEVYTGDEPDFTAGYCLTFVAFHLFDAAGNELDIEMLDPSTVDDLLIYPPERHVHFDLRLCGGQRQPSAGHAAGSESAAATTFFLVPGADRCPDGTVFPAFWGEVRLVQPLQEVSCQDLGGVQTSVSGCGG
ncbi:MAG: hypothetical protein HYY35_00120 [Deltaproteobacteria bacterium]|nr:hypothetical protein [Deltaproteobacteria bacterium]